MDFRGSGLQRVLRANPIALLRDPFYQRIAMKPSSVVWSLKHRDAVWLCLAAVLALALLNSVVFYTGFGSGDDRQYILAGYKMATGQRVGFHLGHVRLAMTVPCMLILKATGNSLLAVTMSFCVFLLLLVYGTYKLGVTCGVPTTASLFAAFLVAMCPLLVRYSTLVMPDVPLACYITYSVLFAVKACTVDSSGRKRLSTTLCWVALSSILAVLAYLTKLSALLAMPLIVGILLADALSKKRLWSRATIASIIVFCSIPLLALLLEQQVINYLTGGASQLRFSLAQSTFMDNPVIVERLSMVPTDPLERLRLVVTKLQVLGPWRWLLFAAGLVYPFLSARKWVLYGAFAWFFVYLTWGSTSLTRYIPNTIPPRYYMIVLPFVFLMAATLLRTVIVRLAKIVRSRPVRATMLAVLSAMLLISVAGSYSKMAMPYTALKFAEVQATSKALKLLFESSDRPVVLSAFLSIRLEPLFLQGRDERLILTDQHSRVEDILQCLALPERCYYLEAERESADFSHYGYDNAIDKMVDATLAGSPNADARFAVKEVMTVRPDASRADWILRGWETSGLQPSAAGDFASLRPGVLVRGLGPSPAYSGPTYATRDIAPEWHRAGTEAVLERWQLLSKFAGEYTLSTNTVGEPELRLTMARSEYVWLSPNLGKGHPPRFTVESGKRCVISVDTEMSPTIHAELLLRFAQSNGVEGTAQKRVDLENGHRSIEIVSHGGTLLFTPHFKIYGKGKFRLKNLRSLCAQAE